MLRKTEGRRRSGWQRMRQLDGITNSMDMSKLLEMVKDREAWHAAVHRVAKSQTRDMTQWLNSNKKTPYWHNKRHFYCSLRKFQECKGLYQKPRRKTKYVFPIISHNVQLSWWFTGKESACQCKLLGFDPWSQNIPVLVEQLSPCTTTTEPKCCNYWSLSA